MLSDCRGRNPSTSTGHSLAMTEEVVASREVVWRFLPTICHSERSEESPPRPMSF